MKKETYRDGEVIGKDNDGCLILWNSKKNAGENCGETLEQFGVDNLFPNELLRLNIDQTGASLS